MVACGWRTHGRRNGSAALLSPIAACAHLHAVKQGPRDGVKDVGGAEEEALAQVNGRIDVVVHKAVILRGGDAHVAQRTPTPRSPRHSKCW